STYPDINNNMDFDIFMTLMLHTGYATYAEDTYSTDKVKIRIPNNEVALCFKSKFENFYTKNNHRWFNQTLSLVDLLMENKTDKAQTLISSMLKEFLSIRNSGDELYYHGFMTGILGIAAAARGLEYHEEIETGSGFSDIVIENFDLETACILELKKTEKLEDCYDAAQNASRQIIQKDYTSKFISKGYKKINGIGIGFAKKSCKIVSLGNLVEASADQ
ncbi:MAG: PD-(D/E)XK nuclease domain-containing protein, partial [Succinivibrio sp.]|nr:PD-(D/E)XK nuclease domain-containing protein [Succinivibrio sp.]